MFSVTPSGLVPASNRNLCSCPALVTVTSAENPCSAISESGTRPSAIIASGRHGLRARSNRRAGPWSVIRASVTLSMRMTTVTESTGSRSISMAGLHVVPYRGGQAGRAVIHAHGNIVGKGT